MVVSNSNNLDRQLNELSSFLLSTLDEFQFFGRFSGFMLDLTGEYKVRIYKAFEDGSSQLIADNGVGIENGEVLASGKGLSGYVIRTRRAYYSNNVKRDPLLAIHKYDDQVQAELCIPVNCKGAILATIHIQSDKTARNFNESDVAQIIQILNELERPFSNMKMYLVAKHLNQELLKRIEAKEKEIERNRNLSNDGPTVNQSDLILLGHSKAFTDVIEMSNRIAQTEIPVLLEGETGTGKETIARKIHANSKRANGAIITVNCNFAQNSQAEYQLESEIFGNQDKKGALELCNGGTIVLDEISELPIALQGKLLLTLTKGLANRIGGLQAYAVNVRIISLSKKNLKKLVEEGKFREDLYYRLSTAHIKVPSLKERGDDIRILAEYYLNLKKSREEVKSLTSSAIQLLGEYYWPGNIRELKNIMERVYILSDGKFIDETNLPTTLKEMPVVEKQVVEKFSEKTLGDLEKEHIIRTLEHLKGNKTKTAKSLGITVKTLYNKLHSYGLALQNDTQEVTLQ